MWFGNPLLNELRALTNAMEQLKNDFIALEDRSIFQDAARLNRIINHMGIIIGHIEHYADKELALFEREEISRSCIAIVRQIRDTRYQDILRSLTYGKTIQERNIPKIQNLRKLVELLGSQEEMGVLTRNDVRFELSQRQKAMDKSKSYLNPKEKGCYHFADLSRVFHVLRKGLISISYAKREFEHDLREGVDNMQGHNFLSVFDTYSYWTLYKYFDDKGTLPKIKEGKITEEMFKDTLSRLSQLNFSKFAKENVEILRHNGLFNGNVNGSLYFEFIQQTIVHIGNNLLAKFPTDLVSRFGDVIFVINDTAELFPTHTNAYAFEGLFKDYIEPEKIVGIVMINQKHKQYLEEFVKFVGIPLYNAEGKLLWPK